MSVAATIAIALAALMGGLAIGALAGFLLAQWRAARHLAQSDARLRATFDSVAGESLRANSELFLRMAREALSREHVIGEGALKEREVAISQLIEPLRVALERTEAQVQSPGARAPRGLCRLARAIETLAGGHAQLQRETRALVTALRRPEVRGRWGEITLRRVVELAGLAEHCDFTEQQHIGGPEGALRPDLVVHMPDGRDLVIDVKTPLDAYLEALESPTDDGRQLCLKRHAQQLETHVRQLASKAYWAQFHTSPEFAVLFLPGDQFLSAALAERPDIMDSALKQAVIIATPSTLIALLKSVAYGWRQAAVAHNAALIRDLGQELYRRLATFTGHLGKGRSTARWRDRGLQCGRRIARAAGAAAGATLHRARRHRRCRSGNARARDAACAPQHGVVGTGGSASGSRRRPRRRAPPARMSFDPRTLVPRADELAGRVIAITGASDGIGQSGRARLCTPRRTARADRPQRRQTSERARARSSRRRRRREHRHPRSGERARARLRRARGGDPRALRAARWPGAQCGILARLRRSSITTCPPGAGCCT